MHILKILITTLLIICTISAGAEIYKWKDANGVIHFTENKPEKIQSEEFHVRSYNRVSFVNSGIDEKEELTTDNKILSRPKKVIMYSAQWCGVCKKAKKYFKKNHIRYSNYDIDTNKSAKARYKKMGAKGVPVIFVGKKRMNGFSIAGFKHLYE